MDTNVLDTIDMRQLGSELQRARKRKGLTQEAAGKVIDVTRTTMVAIEKGDRRIKASELVKLASAYGSSIHDLLRKRPDIESLEVQFRGPFVRTEQDEQDIEPVAGEFEELCRNYLEIELLTKSPLVRKYPDEYPIAGQPVETTAEAIALEERNRLGLGDGPIPVLRDVLEQDVGMRIFYLPMPPRFSEIYAYTEELGGCMAANALHPEERRRWSLAHGYFHFLSTRRSAEVTRVNGYQRQPESERFADAFARYFLMPTAGLTRRFSEIQRKSKVTPASLCTLANYYGVSVEALTRRLETMRLLHSGTWEKIMDMKWRTLQRELGLTEIPARDQKLPVRFIFLTFEAFKEGLISEGQLARFLDADRLSARRMAEELARGENHTGHSGSSDPDIAE